MSANWHEINWDFTGFWVNSVDQKASSVRDDIPERINFGEQTTLHTNWIWSNLVTISILNSFGAAPKPGIPTWICFRRWKKQENKIMKIFQFKFKKIKFWWRRRRRRRRYYKVKDCAFALSNQRKFFRGKRMFWMWKAKHEKQHTMGNGVGGKYIIWEMNVGKLILKTIRRSEGNTERRKHSWKNIGVWQVCDFRWCRWSHLLGEISESNSTEIQKL